MNINPDYLIKIWAMSVCLFVCMCVWDVYCHILWHYVSCLYLGSGWRNQPQSFSTLKVWSGRSHWIHLGFLISIPGRVFNCFVEFLAVLSSFQPFCQVFNRFVEFSTALLSFQPFCRVFNCFVEFSTNLSSFQLFWEFSIVLLSFQPFCRVFNRFDEF